MSEQVLSKLKLFSYTIEQLAGPLLVFFIAFTHHLFFGDDLVSSFFAGSALISLIFVATFDKVGLYIATFLQVAFIGWVQLTSPFELWHQLFFSASLMLSLFATYLNELEVPQETKEVPSTALTEQTPLTEQKDRLWQELFDARQEIKNLYQQKQEIEAERAAKFQEVCSEKDEKLLFLQHHLEATLIDKHQIIKQRDTAEEDIKKLLGHMHEMAVSIEDLKNQSKIQPCPEIPDVKTGDNALYRQLKQQFEEKSRVLDETRKELFLAQEKIEVQRLELGDFHESSEEVKHLMQLLKQADSNLEAQKKAHEEELIGYEEVIQGLLHQLNDKQSCS
jgi:hypothetical protein